MDTNQPTDPIVSINNQLINPAPEKPKKKLHIPKIAVLIIFFLILLVLMQGSLYLAKKSNSSPIPSPDPVTMITPTSDPTSGWNTFTSSAWQYTFRYPSDWTDLTQELVVNSGESGNLISSLDLEKTDYSNVKKGAYIYGPYTQAVLRGNWENVFTNYTSKPVEVIEDLIILNNQEAKIGIIKNTNSTEMVIFYKYPTPIKFDGIAKPVEWSFLSLVSSVNDFEKNKEIFEQLLSTFKFTVSDPLIVTPDSSDGNSSSTTNPDQTEPAQPIMVACTMEAKICPDGVTSVGRSGPKCEFEKCPGE